MNGGCLWKLWFVTLDPLEGPTYLLLWRKSEIFWYSYKVNMCSLQIERDPILEGVVWNNLGLIQLLHLDPWHLNITDFEVSVHYTHSLPRDYWNLTWLKESELLWKVVSFPLLIPRCFNLRPITLFPREVCIHGWQFLKCNVPLFMFYGSCHSPPCLSQELCISSSKVLWIISWL